MSEKMNDNLQEAITEAVLKAAFREAAEQEFAELEAMKIEVPSPTERQRKEIETAIRKMNRNRKHGVGRVWKAVAMVAIFFCITASVIMAQPIVRASVWDFVVSFYEKYLSFNFGAEEANANYVLGEYTVTYVPVGYELVENQSTPIKTKLVFSNAQDTITVTYYPTAINSVLVDYEQAEKEVLSIGEYDGYLIRQDDDDAKWLIWGDNTKTFLIITTKSDKEMIKIAKNIK